MAGLPARLVALAALLVSPPAARCQARSASMLPWRPAYADRWAAPSDSAVQQSVQAVYQPPADQSASTGTDQDRDLAHLGDYEALLSEAAAAWLAQQQQQQQDDAELPSSLRSPAGAPNRGILEQLLQRPSGGGQGDVGSLLGTLLSSSNNGGAGGGPSALAALLTTTTARPTRIFDRFVIRDGNPFATQRPKTTPGGGATQEPSKTTEAVDEADKFDAGFQIFSQIFAGNNAVDGQAANGFADTPAPAPLTTVTTTRAPPPPPPAPTAPAAPAVPVGWPFYTTPRPASTTSRPLPPPPSAYFGNKVDSRPTRAPRPPGLPFYYNPDAPPAGPPPPPPTPEPQINLGVLLSSVTQLVRSDGPSMIAALGDAYTYIQEGNILGMLQGVVPVFSRATPVIMNMLNSVAPVVEKSDIYGPPISGAPGISGLFGSFAGLFGGGRRRPLRRQPLTRISPPGYSQPYYMGQVVGSGMKLVTYLINHGTTVVRARHPPVDFGWVREAIGAENAEFLRSWVERVISRRS